MEPRQEQLRAGLTALGFDDVRFASLTSLAGEPLRAWLAAGMQADMQWLDRTADKRLRPELVLPGVKSIVMLGVNYWSEPPPNSGDATPSSRFGSGGDEGVASPVISPRSETRARPVWARYACYDDYHDTIKPALVKAGRLLEEIYGVAGDDYRCYVDTGPVIERGWAARAGLGFVGKNAMLISRRHGNWLFLASILTRVEFTPDAPVRRQASDFADVGLLCGKCTRCLDACPTAAFAAPGVVDSRRCISYQTIENKGVIPRELREGIGQRIYGCDVCLEVCPWNRFAQAGRSALLAARGEIAELPLQELLALTPERFAAVFRGTPIKRVKLAGLLRNACVVAGNSGDATLLESLVKLAAHEFPLVRIHAVWAAHRLGGADRLRAARATESDPAVLAEYTWWDEARFSETPRSSPSPPQPAVAPDDPAGR
jgi:epoxyqueuosine reductase